MSKNLNLPLAKIKKICKLDPDVQNVSGDAIKLITFATESYVQLLAKSAFKYASNESRKTVQLKDIERCIKNDFHFSLLDGALTDWPEIENSLASSLIDNNNKINPNDENEIVNWPGDDVENFNENDENLILMENMTTESQKQQFEQNEKLLEENISNKLILLSPRKSPPLQNNIGDIEDF